MHVQSISPKHAWVLAARPKTLPAAIGPVLVGTALAVADGSFAWMPALATLLAALCLQIGSNLANDYFDALNGADTPERVGPTRVTATGLVSHASMRIGIIVVFTAAALIGVYLIWIGGWPIFAIGTAAILAALAYTGGPKPFGYMGLGDFFVFAFFGPVAVCGTYYVQAHTVTTVAVFAGIAMGALITAILVVNNLRDIKSDQLAGKHTLAVRLGIAGTRMEFLLLLVVAYVIPLLLAFMAGSPWLLSPLVTLPRARQLNALIRRASDGPTLNGALAGTAQLSLFFALCLAAGILFSALPG